MGSDGEAFGRAFAAAGLRCFHAIDFRRATASTNEDAQPLLGDPQAAGTVIVADVQTAGVGRHGRRWIARTGSGLLFTAILPTEIASTAAWAVTLWTGLAVAAALERRAIAATLQWPNDLLVDGRKLCGILCISRISGSRAAIGCGIGLNVHRPVRDPALEEILPAPVFIDDLIVTGEDARPELLVEILRAMETDLAALDHPEQIARRWEDRAGLPGARYRFALDDGAEVEGDALRIAHGGGIVVRINGEERTIEHAEARVLR